MIEAIERIIEELKEEKIPYITATHDINNIASESVMKRLGMTYQYTYEEIVQPKNKNVTFRMYQLNLEDNQKTYTEFLNKAIKCYKEENV